MQKKHLLIFDFDQTIIDVDSEFSMVEKLCPDLFEERIKGDLYLKYKWIDLNNYIYTRLKQNGYNYKDVKEYLTSLKLSPNFKELFEYIKKNKNKFETLILSANNTHVINLILTSHNIRDCIDHICCNEGVIDEDNILKIIPTNEKYEHCEDDKPFLCKSLFFEDFIKNKETIFDKVFYVADGGNDFCLSKKLGNNDIIFPRKDYGLYKILYDKNGKNEVKAKIVSWENGNDICKEIMKY